MDTHGNKHKEIQPTTKNSTPFLRKIGKLITGTFDRLMGVSDVDYGVVLPSDVRYALAYRGTKFSENYTGAALSKDDVLSLLQPQYGLLGFYLALKSVEFTRPDLYTKKIEQACQIIYDEKTLEEGRSEMLKMCASLLKDLPDQDFGVLTEFGQCVSGTKAGQISRMGFGNMEKRIFHVVEMLSGDEELVLVANAAFIGLEGFVQILKEGKMDHFYIMDPDEQGLDGESEIIRKVTVSDGKMQTKIASVSIMDLERKVIAIDDTQNTGSTGDRVTNFFRDHGCKDVTYTAGSFPNGVI